MKELWKQIKEIGAILSVFRSYVWITLGITGAVTWAAHLAHLGLPRIVEIDAVLLFCLVEAFSLAVRFRPRIKVELAPTSGPSPYIFLRVRNRSNGRDFSATCQVLSVRNTNAHHINQTVDLKWERTSDRSLRIEGGETASLVVAMLQANRPHGGYAIFIHAWNEAGSPYPRWMWTWDAYSDNTPEVDILFEITGAESKEPFRAAFRMSVENWPENALPSSAPTSLRLTEIAIPAWAT